MQLVHTEEITRITSRQVPSAGLALGAALGTGSAAETITCQCSRQCGVSHWSQCSALPSADDAMIDEEIILAEQDALLRAAFAELPPRCQQLLSMLLSDPPRSYGEIRAVLGIPVGSIGPQRARCLDRLRKSIASCTLDEGSQGSGQNRLGASFLPITGMADPEGPARELSPWPTSVPNSPQKHRPTPRCRIPATPRWSADAPPG